ncbi:MAG: hypothetical protein HKP61_11795 [Dactylosporangium sp.]|nr:hypothetical protein [Dactylosporangium sp.]NNJ61606.1 hypothetical protein [Dactylosporangium sp.]
MSPSTYPQAAPPPPRPSAHPDGPEPAGTPRKSGNSRTRLILAVGAVAVIGLLILTVAVIAGGGDSPAASGGGSAGGAGSAHAVTAPLEGRQKATFEVVTGAESLTVRSDDLGDDLYRISTPEDGNLVPNAVVTGDNVLLALDGSGKVGGAASVEVLLNDQVIWQLKLAGGGLKETIDFGTGKLSGVDLASGAGEIELSLPKATGTLAVKLTGGAGKFTVHLAKDLPVQVKIDGAGAGVVTIDGQTKNAVKAGTELAPSEWASATDRYTVEASAGVSNLVVDRTT